MEIRNMEKKKIVIGLGLGSLVLMAPFSAFAFGKAGFDNENNYYGSLIDKPDYEMQINRLEKTIERKIQQANIILENIEVSDEVLADLNDIILEYSELESYLEDADLSEEQKEDLKELFLDYKEEATSLTTEFRELIRNNLSDEEIASLKENLRESHFENKGDFNKGRLHFNAETLAIIDSDLAETYSNGELTEIEVSDKVKEIMDSLSEDEREDLIESMPHKRKHENRINSIES